MCRVDTRTIQCEKKKFVQHSTKVQREPTSHPHSVQVTSTTSPPNWKCLQSSLPLDTRSRSPSLINTRHTTTQLFIQSPILRTRYTAPSLHPPTSCCVTFQLRNRHSLIPIPNSTLLSTIYLVRLLGSHNVLRQSESKSKQNRSASYSPPPPPPRTVLQYPTPSQQPPIFQFCSIRDP